GGNALRARSAVTRWLGCLKALVLLGFITGPSVPNPTVIMGDACQSCFADIMGAAYRQELQAQLTVEIASCWPASVSLQTLYHQPAVVKLVWSIVPGRGNLPALPLAERLAISM